MPDKDDSSSNTQSRLGKAYREAGPYIGIGVQLAGSFLFFLGLGVWADGQLKSSPLFLLLGLAAAMTAMIVLVVRIIKLADAKKKFTPAKKEYES